MAYVGLILAVLIDVSFRLLAPDRFGLQSAPPSLPLITALYIGFHSHRSNQLGLAIVLGLLADTFSAQPLGHFAFLYGAIAYLARSVRRYLPPDAAFSFIVASFFCCLVTAFLSLTMALITTRGYLGAGFARAMLEAFTSSLCAPFVFALWDKSRLFKRAFGEITYDFA